MSQDLEEYKRKELEGMMAQIDSVSMDDIKANGFTIRNGSKLLKLSVTKIEDLTMEQEIREELRIKLTERLASIKEKLNQKITEVIQYTSKIRIEAERKERELEEKIKAAKPMPDVYFKHAQRGLSVIKGEGRDEMIWFVQGIYWPKTVDKKPIDPKYSKKLLTNIVFMIKTRNNLVTSVSTRQPIGLDFLEHYHQQKPDCWGSWRPDKEFKTPDDIIKIARTAEAVLENVNSNSLANRSPRGLPRFATLQRHLIQPKVAKTKSEEELVLSQATRRTGMSPEVRSQDEDVWSL